MYPVPSAILVPPNTLFVDSEQITVVFRKITDAKFVALAKQSLF
jgi:hypothetical protein